MFDFLALNFVKGKTNIYTLTVAAVYTDLVYTDVGLYKQLENVRRWSSPCRYWTLPFSNEVRHKFGVHPHSRTALSNTELYSGDFGIVLNREGIFPD